MPNKRKQKRRRKCKNCFSSRYRSKRQSGGFLSRYDFAYAGRDTVNQAAYHVKKIAPNLIRTTSKELDAITARRINQLTYTTGKEIKRIAPVIIKGAIEELYKTPFRLLAQFGRKKYKQLKSKVYRRLGLNGRR